MKIFLALLFLALPTYAQYAHRSVPGWSGPGTPYGTAPTITGAGSGACPGIGCVTIPTTGVSVLTITLGATGACPGANCTIQFSCSNDGWATVVPIDADAITNGQMAGSPSSTTIATGTFVMPTYGFKECGAYASTYVSGTASVRLDAEPASLPGIAYAPHYCDKTVAFTTQGTTSVVKQIAEVTGQHIFVCGWILHASTATTGTSLTWYSGSGANCASGSNAAVGGPFVGTTPTTAPATPNSSYGPVSPGVRMTLAAGDALCTKQASATNATTLSGTIFYTQN